MRTTTLVILALLTIGGFGFAGLAWSIAGKTESAIHEIEALIGVLVGTVAFAGAAIVHAADRLERAIDRGTQVTLNEAKLAELRAKGGH